MDVKEKLEKTKANRCALADPETLLEEGQSQLCFFK